MHNLENDLNTNKHDKADIAIERNFLPSQLVRKKLIKFG